MGFQEENVMDQEDISVSMTSVRAGEQNIPALPEDDGLKKNLPDHETNVKDAKNAFEEMTEEKSAETALLESAESENTDLQLSPNVTPEPQDPEHAHLNVVAKSMPGLGSYLEVSDDKGEGHGDPELEAAVKDFGETPLDVENATPEEIDKVIKAGTDLSERYGLRLNMYVALSDGKHAKYRIRQGKVYRKIKKAIKKHGGSFKIWVKKEVKTSSLRSIQVYMSLAEVPNIIRYAVLGLDRLIQIERVVRGKAGDDPVEDFLVENNIVFDPTQEFDLEAFKLQVDVVLAQEKLLANGIDSIPNEKIEALLRNDIKLQNRHIHELTLVKKINGDLGTYMDQILATDGKPEPVDDPDRKAEYFNNTANKFMKAISTGLKDNAYFGQVTPDIVREIRLKIDLLENRIINSN